MRVFFFSLAAMAVLTAGSAQASAPDMRVRIADLDLSRAADVATAQSRIEQSTHKFCSQLSAYPISGDRATCREAMQAAAIAQLAGARVNSVARLASR
jgi:UrcA family protein